MSKAKIASKNNPEGRGQVKKYYHNGKEIRPVKLIANRRSFFAAEYDESGDVVVDPNGRVLTWDSAKNLG